MKNIIHKFLFPNYEKEIEDLKKPFSNFELELLYNNNKELFYQLIVKEFNGEIPHTVLEPVLKLFEEQSEDIERWVLWQSYEMRRRVMLTPANPLKIQFYDGVLFFLKNFQIMSHNKRTGNNLKSSTQSTDGVVEPSFIEEAMKGVEDFKIGFYKKYEATETNKNTSSKDGKAVGDQIS